MAATLASIRKLHGGTVAPSSTLIYVEKRGLFLKRLPDGQAIQLTSGTALRHPDFSPSGRWIAYRDGDLWHVISAEGGEPKQLAAGPSAWNPAVDILTISSPNAGTQLFGAATGWRPSRLANSGNNLPVFSPDGKDFVFARDLMSVMAAAGSSRVSDLMLGSVARANAEASVLASSTSAGFIPYGWSRDGKHIFYWEDRDFSASVMADGLALFGLSHDTGLLQPLNIKTLVYDDWLASSPSSDLLAVTSGIGRESWNNKRIAVWNPQTAQLRYLSDKHVSSIAPAWSPDGRKLAHVSGRRRRASRVAKLQSVFLVSDASWFKAWQRGATPKAITPDSEDREECPIWIDKDQLLICRIDQNDTATVWLIDSEGTRAKQVSGPLSTENGWFRYYDYVNLRALFDWLPAGAGNNATP